VPLKVSIYKPAQCLHFQFVFLRILQSCFYKQTTNALTFQRRGDSRVRENDDIAALAVIQFGSVLIKMHFESFVFCVVDNIEFIGLHVIFPFAFRAQ
jgi:hypothetical protein